MNDPADILDTIVAELSEYHRTHNEYTITPSLLTEVTRTVNRLILTPGSRYGSLYSGLGFDERDALGDAIEHLLKERAGVKGQLIHKIYFEYPAATLASGQQFTLAHARKCLRMFVEQAFKRHIPGSTAKNQLALAIKKLRQIPFTTHGSGQHRRFTMAQDAPNFTPETPLPLEQQVRQAIRFASLIPKIPLSDDAERAESPWTTPNFSAVLLLILEYAPGLSLDQLKRILEEILTDRPGASFTSIDDLVSEIDRNHDPLELGIDAVLQAREIARSIWDSTHISTRIILSLQYENWSDEMIAQQTVFIDHKGRTSTKSRAWVTTEFGRFADAVRDAINDLSTTAQNIVLRIIEGYITNFDRNEQR